MCFACEVMYQAGVVATVFFNSCVFVAVRDCTGLLPRECSYGFIVTCDVGSYWRLLAHGLHRCSRTLGWGCWGMTLDLCTLEFWQGVGWQW